MTPSTLTLTRTRNIIDETKSNYAPTTTDRDVGRNAETSGADLRDRVDEILDSTAGGGEASAQSKASGQPQLKVGEEGEQDVHEMAAKRQP